MTREEAIAFFKDMNECTYGNLEAVEMAIEALENEQTLQKELEEKTNGDMINALFPNAKNIRVDGGYPLNFIIEWEWHRNLKEWWDAPYKENIQ